MKEHLQKSILCSGLLIKLDIGIHRCEQRQFSYPQKKESFLHLEVETKKHVQKKAMENNFFLQSFPEEQLHFNLVIETVKKTRRGSK